MTKHIKLAHSYESGYSLLVRTKENGEPIDFEPFVCAWCYDDERKDWLAGHYFQDITDAVEFFKGSYTDRYHRS